MIKVECTQSELSIDDLCDFSVSPPSQREEEDPQDQEVKKYHALLLQYYLDQGLDEVNSHHPRYNYGPIRNQGALDTEVSFESRVKSQPQTFLNHSSGSPQKQGKNLKLDASICLKQLKEDKKQQQEFDFSPNLPEQTLTRLRRKKKLSKRTVKIISQRFDQYFETSMNQRSEAQKSLTLRQISEEYKMSLSQVTKLYNQWMEDPSLYSRLNGIPSKKSTSQAKLTRQRLQHMARLLKENPFMTQYELTVELNKIEDLKTLKNGKMTDITRTKVARLLKAGRFKKKRVKCVPKQRNTSQSIEKRYEYCLKYQDIWSKNGKIFFLDESSFDQYMTRDKAWARPNEEITVNCPISKGKRLSLIAVIAQDGICHWRVIEGTYRKYEFVDFIKQMFARTVQIEAEERQLARQEGIEDQQIEKWLILDNVATHDKQITTQLGQYHNINVLFLPPNSPQLNPIENLFHEIKCKIRKTNYSGEKQLLQILQRTLRQYQDKDLGNYYANVEKYVNKGINKEKF